MGYERLFEVKFFESNLNKELSESVLLKYLSEMAIDHTNKLASDFPDIVISDMGWMIYKYKGEIESMPKVGETFKIKTWTSRIYKFYANREFLVLDKDENILARVSTLWMYVDLIKRRPRRIPAEFAEYYGIKDDMFFKDFEDLKDKLESQAGIDFRVRRSDIDSNRHVNNAIYFEWMIESMPNQIYENYCLKEFDIVFKKETKYNDIILSEVEFIELGDDLFECNHLILDKNTLETRTLGRTIWEKRE